MRFASHESGTGPELLSRIKHLHPRFARDSSMGRPIGVFLDTPLEDGRYAPRVRYSAGIDRRKTEAAREVGDQTRREHRDGTRATAV